MIDKEHEQEERVGHDSTTMPGGEKELTGDPGRTPGAAEGDRRTVEEDLRQKRQD